LQGNTDIRLITANELSNHGGHEVRKRCDPTQPVGHACSRREFLKTASAVGAAAATGISLLRPTPAAAQTMPMPSGTGKPGARYVIRAGAVLSMDSGIGDFTQADVLVEGKNIVAIAPAIDAGQCGGDRCERHDRDARGSSIRITISSRPRCAAFSPTVSYSMTGNRMEP
jgi:hypothetical protein